MLTIKKESNRDFMVLNLSDPQLSNGEWREGEKNREILVNTIKELVDRVKPDLITVSGDVAWAGNKMAYEALGKFLDSFKIPWAVVWGNHDNQGGPQLIEEVVQLYENFSFFCYERGDESLGNGNYVIGIEENGALVEAIIMMDSHDRMPFTDKDGNVGEAWAKLIPEQIVWYRNQIEMLKKLGCKETILITHIPIFAYRRAFEAVNSEELVGVGHEEVSCYAVEDGVFEAVKELGSTKHIIVGHDHVNNWMIPYEGVQLIYALKTGPGCYWEPELNGGTAIRITSDGVADVHHEFVEVNI